MIFVRTVGDSSEEPTRLPRPSLPRKESFMTTSIFLTGIEDSDEENKKGSTPPKKKMKKKS